MIDERIAAADPAADVPDPSADECRLAIDAIYARSARSRVQRRVLAAVCLLGIALAAGLTLAPRGDDPALPGAVRAFAATVAARDGVLHMASRSRWITPLDELPRRAMADEEWESWTMLDGSRWRDRRTMAGEAGYVEGAGADDGSQRVYESARNRIVVEPPIRGRRVPPPPEADWSLLLIRMQRSIRERRLRIAGETSIEGHAAYIVIPDNLPDVRLYIGRDDGRLMRIEEQPGTGLRRTDVKAFDVLPNTPENRALTRLPAHPGATIRRPPP